MAPVPVPAPEAGSPRAAAGSPGGVIWQGRSRTGRARPPTGPARPGPSAALFGFSATGRSPARPGPSCASRLRAPGAGCPAGCSLATACTGGGACPLRGACGGRSLLVVIGGVGEGELQAVGLGQQQADLLVAPARRGQVLQEEQQLLGRDGRSEGTAGQRAPRVRGDCVGATHQALSETQEKAPGQQGGQ